MKNIVTVLLALFITQTLLSNVKKKDFSSTKIKSKIEAMMNEISNNKFGDSGKISLVNYSYKGTIKNENIKKRIIDSYFSSSAPIIINLSGVTVADTTMREDTCVITQTTYPCFEIRTVDEMLQLSEIGREQLELKKNALYEIIKIGYEYIELEWCYKEKKYKVFGVVSSADDNYIYDPIGNNLLTSTCTIKTHIAQGLWKED
ncbi:MAG: hypothetical protein ACRDDZ_09490 [Marinifilaceae bacterium]